MPDLIDKPVSSSHDMVECPSCGRVFETSPGAAICPACSHSFVVGIKREKHSAFAPPAHLKSWRSPFEEYPCAEIGLYAGFGIGFFAGMMLYLYFDHAGINPRIGPRAIVLLSSFAGSAIFAGAGYLIDLLVKKFRR